METVQSTTSVGTSTQSANRFSELTNDEFINIITTELSNQDPLKPSDTSALLQQISDLRSIQTDMDLGTRLDALVDQNEMASASSLIGAQVMGVASDGSVAEGVVSAVVRETEGPVLRLSSGQSLMFKQVHEIHTAAGGSQ